VKWIKSVVYALLFSLLVGFAIGTVLRMRIERSVYLIGSAVASDPLDVGYPRTPILDARHHEEQIRQAV
jgi:hypothetical protein